MIQPDQNRPNQDALISDFLERLQQQVTGLLPRDRLDAVLEQARRAMRQGFADFDLVPRRELDAHLSTLQRLMDTVEDLERRVRALEKSG